MQAIETLPEELFHIVHTFLDDQSRGNLMCSNKIQQNQVNISRTYQETIVIPRSFFGKSLVFLRKFYNTPTNSSVKEISFVDEKSVYPSHSLARNVLPVIVKNFPKLEVLNLKGCKGVSGAGILHIQEMKSLNSLDLSGISELNDTDLLSISKMRQLRSLNLHGCSQITNQGLSHLSLLTSLTHLAIGFMTNEGLRRLAPLQSLRSLSLWASGGIVSGGIEGSLPMSPWRTSLEELNLSFCPGVDNATLDSLSSLSSLRHLDLGDCRNIDNDSIPHIAALSSLTSIDLRGTNVDNNGIVNLSDVLLQYLANQRFPLPFTNITRQGITEAMRRQ
jgi:hypothetical protein